MTDERLKYLRGCRNLLNGLVIIECVEEIDRLKSALLDSERIRCAEKQMLLDEAFRKQLLAEKRIDQTTQAT